MTQPLFRPVRNPVTAFPRIPIALTSKAMNKRTAFVLILGAVGLVGMIMSLGLYLGIRVGKALNAAPTPPKFQDTATVVRQIQSLNQLVSVKFVLEKVVVVEDAKWFGENRLIMVAHGVAKAGFDLKKLEPGDISTDGNRLTIQLPKPLLTDVYLDERRTEVIERSTGILRAMDKDLETEARRYATDRIRAAAIESGILNEATERARLQLTHLAGQMGFQNVEVRVKSP